VSDRSHQQLAVAPVRYSVCAAGETWVSHAIRLAMLTFRLALSFGLHRAPKGGGTPAVLWSGSATPVAVDSMRVYWTDGKNLGT
jgi:hypothetical protein